MCETTKMIARTPKAQRQILALIQACQRASKAVATMIDAYVRTEDADGSVDHA